VTSALFRQDFLCVLRESTVLPYRLTQAVWNPLAYSATIARHGNAVELANVDAACLLAALVLGNGATDAPGYGLSTTRSDEGVNATHCHARFFLFLTSVPLVLPHARTCKRVLSLRSTAALHRYTALHFCSVPVCVVWSFVLFEGCRVCSFCSFRFVVSWVSCR
jgi:hypothetical protein